LVEVKVMSKTDSKNEKPFYIYRENKGYFYGPGAGPALDGKPFNWKLSGSQKQENENDGS
jgi:hypothetical protein